MHSYKCLNGLISSHLDLLPLILATSLTVILPFFPNNDVVFTSLHVFLNALV